jgi:predicted nucleic acid-binding protein
LNLVLDSCSTINLHNGGVLGAVFGLRSFGFAFHVGPIVVGECENLSPSLSQHITSGNLVELPDGSISASEFAQVLDKYDLGLGETECIALARRHGYTVCSDDKAARKAATRHLGSGRVTGSLHLLRECVRLGQMTSQAASAAYETMRSRGAFLPDLASSYFEC